MTNDAKRVVYLFGAGATHAEILLSDFDYPLLMKDISKRVFEEQIEGKKIKKEFFPHAEAENLNIEHILSLFEASLNVKKYSDYINKLRELFQKDILVGVRRKKDYLNPKLTKTLLALHNCEKIEQKEKLSGIVTLNYDSLLDIACSETYGGINYGIEWVSEFYGKIDNDAPPLLKMHGSFNWKIQYPIVVSEDEKFLNECNSYWIPPTTYKRIENYPFNYLWGRAFELLDCDILRVIGCSFDQNDWGLLNLLFKSQNEQKNAYRIELIDRINFAKEIRERYGFLKKLTSINDIMDLGISDTDVIPDDNYYYFWLKKKLESYGEILTDRDIVKLNNLLGEEVL